MVSGRVDHASSLARRGMSSMRLTPYEKVRSPHSLRTDIGTQAVSIQWILDELACGLCHGTIRNAMVIRNCMHRFCADCILPKIHAGLKKCPVCKKLLLKKTPLKSDANFDAVINKFALSPDKRCIKRPISESANLCFLKRRMMHSEKNAPSRQSFISRTLPESPKCSPSLKSKGRSLVKAEQIGASDIKPPVHNETHSETSEPSLFIDETTSDDVIVNVSQPLSSKTSVEESSSLVRSPNSTLSVYEGVDQQHSRNSMVNFTSPNASVVMLGPGIINVESSKRLTTSGHCDTPLIVFQNPGGMNGLSSGHIKTMRNSSPNHSISKKILSIQPHPSSSQLVSVPSMSSANAYSICPNNSAHSCSFEANGLPTENEQSEKCSSEKDQSKIALKCASMMQSPPSMICSIEASSIVPEYLLHPQRQRLASDIEAELVLWPDVSVLENCFLPCAAKRPRFLITLLTATIRHLSQFLVRRIDFESSVFKLDKHHVSICAVSADLPLEDVLVVNETGEGQFTAVDVRRPNYDVRSSSIFTVKLPFKGLDETTTVEALRREHWANKKRPLKLVFKINAV